MPWLSRGGQDAKGGIAPECPEVLFVPHPYRNFPYRTPLTGFPWSRQNGVSNFPKHQRRDGSPFRGYASTVGHCELHSRLPLLEGNLDGNLGGNLEGDTPCRGWIFISTWPLELGSLCPLPTETLVCADVKLVERMSGQSGTGLMEWCRAGNRSQTNRREE